MTRCRPMWRPLTFVGLPSSEKSARLRVVRDAHSTPCGFVPIREAIEAAISLTRAFLRHALRNRFFVTNNSRDLLLKLGSVLARLVIST